MKIALVGGAGLIGHHLALHLKHEGHDVCVIDALLVNNFYSLWEVREKAETQIYLDMIEERLRKMSQAGVRDVRADAKDYHLLSKILSAFQPDAVIHLAAVAHIDRANRQPWATLNDSMRTLENTLDVCRALKVKHFIFFSSSTVYGDFTEPTVTEETPCHPKGIYGNMKFASERIVSAYGDVFDLPCTIVRPCALYGPRCVSGRVTQKFLENAYFERVSIIEGDGTGVHDFTYIADLVHGIEAVLNNREAAAGETFNITGDNARSLLDLAESVKQSFPQALFDFGPIDPEKPSRGTLSCAKARAKLGYSPRYTLEEGMKSYCNWFSNFMDRRGLRYAS